MEAKHIAKLFKTMNCTRWNNRDSARFIISAKWFAKWKAYIGYDEFILKSSKGNSGTSMLFLNTTHPGPILNDKLLIDSKECLHDYACQSEICNTALRETAEENKDYYIVTSDIWNYLHNKYTGLAIPRKSISIGSNGSNYYELNLSKVILLYI